MTPKERAIELVHTMYGWTFDDRDDPNTPNLAAYKCALIAVDEIIRDKKAFNQISIEYWEDVKQEIEKL
jgi:hypothetical protein